MSSTNNMLAEEGNEAHAADYALTLSYSAAG
jgi:hypothetical protein